MVKKSKPIILCVVCGCGEHSDVTEYRDTETRYPYYRRAARLSKRERAERAIVPVVPVEATDSAICETCRDAIERKKPYRPRTGERYFSHGLNPNLRRFYNAQKKQGFPCLSSVAINLKKETDQCS